MNRSDLVVGSAAVTLATLLGWAWPAWISCLPPSLTCAPTVPYGNPSARRVGLDRSFEHGLGDFVEADGRLLQLIASNQGERGHDAGRRDDGPDEKGGS